MNQEKDNWQKKFEKREKELKKWWEETEEVSLTAMEDAIDEQLAKLRRDLLAEMAQELEEKGIEEERLCPRCEKPLSRNGEKKREIRLKGGEKLKIEREQRRCPECGMTIFPPR